MILSETRTTTFRRNELLEQLLAELEQDLRPAEEKLISRYRNATLKHPCVMVMGPLRSGTTLFMQWLANSGLVAYPSNLLSRFYHSPIVGAKIQLLLTDPRYNFRDELGEFIAQVNYSSDNGKTKGVLAPNEFWYFWRRFLKEPSRDVWSDAELHQTMDITALQAELAGMIEVFDKPFAAKGMLFNYNIPFLDEVLGNAFFIQIKRDPITNVASILEARKRQLGSDSTWYSFKIPEYAQLEKLEPIQQAAGQLHYINQAITTGIDQVAEHRKMVVEYEEFCESPEKVFNELCKKLGRDCSVYNGPQSFKITRSSAVTDASAISSALARYE